MKNTISAISLIFFFSFLNQTYSQKELPEFGKPSMEELLMKQCEFDKDAAAMKLIDYRESEFILDYTIKIETERRIRIKIFNEKGYSHANIRIPYNGRKKASKITDISAYIYSLDSLNNITVQKIEKKQIFKDKSNEGVSTIAFTFPNLKPGSVIEYRYKKTDKNTIHFEPWFFQDKIPVLNSICKIIKPSVVQLDRRFITYDSVKTSYSVKYPKYLRYSLQTYTYTLNEIPSFKMEPMMTSVKDNLQRIEFALMPSFGFMDFALGGRNRWTLFNAVLSKASYFGGLADKKIAGTDQIIDSAKRLASFEDRVNFIYEKVKSKVIWDESQTFYADDDIESVWKDGVGNSAEINFIILNLLKKLKIQSYPILISTRENGKPDKEFLSFSQFNGVDVLLKDSSSTYFILDGTQKHQSFKIPPLNILNREVFIVDSDSSKWVSVSDERPLLKTTAAANGFIDKEGVMKGEAFLYYYDLMKTQHITERNRKKNSDEDEEEEKDFIEKSANDIKIDSLTEKDAEEALRPLSTNFKYTYKLSQTDDYYFLDPFFLSSFRKNPFTDSTRNTEIDFGANQYYSTTVYVEVPENFEVAELPTNKLLRLPDSTMMFRRIVSKEADKIFFKNTFEFYRSIFYPEEYPMVREFFMRMYGFINEPIVLKKKK